MTKINVTRQAILATSVGTKDKTSVKTFDDSCIKNGRLYHFNKKTFVTTSGTLKPGYCIHTEKNGKITARFLIQEIL